MSKSSTLLRSRGFSQVFQCTSTTRLDAIALGNTLAQAHDPVRRVSRGNQHLSPSSLLQDKFVGLLVRAGSCQIHSSRTKPLQTARCIHASTRRTNSNAAIKVAPEDEERSGDRDSVETTSGQDELTRHEAVEAVDSQQHADDVQDLETAVLSDIPRERFWKMADIYGIEEEKLQNAEPETEQQLRKRHFNLAPRLVMTPEQEHEATNRRAQEAEPKRRRERVPKEYQAAWTAFNEAISQTSGQLSSDQLWKYFDALPSPQIRYLSGSQIYSLFKHVMWAQYRASQENKTRIFELISQCHAEGFKLRPQHYTSAIVLAGRASRRTTSDQLKEAIEMWVNMESDGVKADDVVFHVLFDLAVRAGRFALADTIFDELKARNMPLNRYYRTSVIQQAGIQQDGDAVRAAFAEFVHAGEIVDTAIMNLVIRCLIQSGEGEAAEHVFENMKQLHADKFQMKLPKTWQDRRFFIKKYNRESRKLREQQDQHASSFFGSRWSNKEQLEELQKLAPVHPDATTYRALIGYHALVSGNLGRLQELLKEMQTEGYNVHGSVYNNVFAGFVRHGGHASSKWSPGELETFWHNFVNSMPLTVLHEDSIVERDSSEVSMSEDDQPLRWSVALCKNVLTAFFICCGKTRMNNVWVEIRARWHDMTGDDRLKLHNFASYRMQGLPGRHIV